MKRKIICIGIVCMFLLATSITSVNASFEGQVGYKVMQIGETVPNPANADVYYVDADAPSGGDGSPGHPFNKIQDGIDAASDGDTVFVFSGVYHNGNAIVDKSINLIGENKDNTIMNDSGEISISADGVTMTGFTIRYTPSLRGVVIESNYNTISDNIIIHPSYYDGIYLQGSNNIITGNTIRNTWNGIYLSESSNNNITGNTIINTHSEGIWAISSNNNVISENSIIGSREESIWIYQESSFNFISGNYIANGSSDGIRLDDSSNNIIVDNTITNLNCKEFGLSGISLDSSPNSVIKGNMITKIGSSDSDIGAANGISLSRSYNITVEENTIADLMAVWATGIEIERSTDRNTIIGNTITDLTATRSARGIELSRVENCIISRNIITNLSSADSSYGIELPAFTSHNIVSENIIACRYNYDDSSVYGIRLRRTPHNTISGNTLTKNRVGIYLEDEETEKNVFSGNTIIENEFGFLLWDSAKDNSISKNTITNNDVGIKVGFLCKKNTISKNNISDNYYLGVYMEEASENKIIANNITNTIYDGVYCDERSKFNRVYHNNFINNGRNAYDKGNNNWDNGVKGNYWDDYTGGDIDGNGIGDIPYDIEPHPLINKDNLPLMNPYVITLPNKPSRPSGPTLGKPGEEYTYTTSTTDSEGDQVFYWFEWGDSTNSDWIGPYDSGETCEATHSWSTKGNYQIKVKAIDDPNGDGDLSDGTESEWSDPLLVVMPKTKSYANTPFIQIPEHLIQRFPLLARLLQLPFFNKLLNLQ